MSIPKDTSKAECEEMKVSKKCDGHSMDQVGDNEWSFTQEPFFTPVGPVQFYDGTITSRHVRINWNTTQPEVRPCSNRLVTKGTGFLSSAVNNSASRLEDLSGQVDFHLEAVASRCGCTKPSNFPAFAVLNNNYLFIKWESLNNSDN